MDGIRKYFVHIIRNRFVKIVLGAVIVIAALDIVFPLPKMKPYSKVITSDKGELLTAYLTSDDKWRLRVRLNEISSDLKKGVIAKEDKWFYWHPGFNPIAIARAFYQNITTGTIQSGASTISMQVARLLEPAERTYINKLLEIFRAVQLELHYSKDEILEMYLSLIPMGGNIEGVKSASYIFFDRPPNKLSLAQSIMLTVIPNDPNRLRIDNDAKVCKEERDHWLKRFSEEVVFPENSLMDAIDEPLVSARYEIPKNAPHFSMVVKDLTRSDIIESTLNLRLQRQSEALLKNYVSRVSGKGVSNGAVLVIDNRTHSVVAYCGSADFYNDRASGQVDGIKAIRSPGSTLKPILFSAAFSKGILTPKMKLLDIPTDFAGYLPENYDLKFNGDVSADYALVNSLNIPSVRLLRKYGFEEFVNLLSRAGFVTIERQKSGLGLSVILGGCGTTLQELTKFYSCFANQGDLYNLRFLKMQESREINIFHPGAVYMASQILANNERPDYPSTLSNVSKLPKIAWKTGTSYGKRDAWAIGYNPDYTIGVWMGNFSGKGSPHLSGAEMALPLLFELFNAIDYAPKRLWFDKPEDLLIREVCSETGLLPSDYCKEITTDYYILNTTIGKKCDLYKEIYVNSKESLEYCPDCLPLSGYKKKAFPFYPPELTLWYSANNIEYKKAPPHNPECKAKHSGEKAPIIVSPSEEFDYLLEENSQQKIMLQGASESSVTIHYWYANGKYIGKCKSGEKIFFSPNHGENKIACMDDKGRESTITIKVNYY